MLKKFSFLMLGMFLIGCGNVNSSNDGNTSDKNTSTETNSSYQNNDTNSTNKKCSKPYLKFKPILDKAELQCPTSKFDANCSRHYGDFKGFSNKYFYYEGCNLRFHMCGDHNRSELRFQKEFYMSDDINKTLEAVVKPLSNTDEFTFLQIHGIYNGLNKPILRVAVYKNRLKLFIFDGDKYIKKDIGEYIPKFMKFKIVAGDSKLYVYKDGKLEINASINYPDKCYYKLGTYLQRNGCGDSIFQNIKINF